MKSARSRMGAALVVVALSTVILTTATVRHAGAGCADAPFLGEICTFAAPQCPKGFLPADGRLMSLLHNQAMFALLRTSFGGDGVTTFALPDLRSSTVIGTGPGVNLPNVVIGQRGGGTQTAPVDTAHPDAQVPSAQLPFVGVSQCIAVLGVFPSPER